MDQQFIAFIESLKNDQRISRYTEAATKQAIVLPFLQYLGWNTSDIDEVTPDFPFLDLHVSFVLRLGNANTVFLQIAPAGEQHVRQQADLLAQAGRLGAQLCVLTTGLIWWFSLPLKSGEREARIFSKLDLAKQDATQAASVLRTLLSRELVRSGEAARQAEAMYGALLREHQLAGALPGVWNSLITEPNAALLESLAAKAEQLCGSRPQASTLNQFFSTYAQWLSLAIDTPAQATSTGTAPLSPTEEPEPRQAKARPVTPAGVTAGEASPPAAVPSHSSSAKHGQRRLEPQASTTREDHGKPSKKVKPVSASVVNKWATLLANDPRYEACTSPKQMDNLLRDLAGQVYDQLPLDEVVENAGKLYMLSVKPKKED